MKGPELELARQVIASLEADFDPKALVSDYRRDLRAILEAKLSGQEIAVPEPAEETPVVDLMEALRASVAAAKTGRRGGRRCEEGCCAAAAKKARPRAKRPGALVRLRKRPDRLELGLEKGLVDLALVDRDAFLDAKLIISWRSIPSSFESSSGVR